jgi:F-type H+-transporting ATPase subunit epsilon
MPLTLQIITPERSLFEEQDVTSVTITAMEGELTILPSHAALMTELRPGPLLFRKGNEEVDVALSGGFLEVRDDRVVVLADTAERSDEIDLARVEQARQRALAQLASREGAMDIAMVMAALERAQARLRVAERRQRRGGPRAGAPRPTAQQPPEREEP